ncbi:MAG: hypothetical protein IJ214_04495 [Clostridia bacterium]|nr:hypothetical protein [Clostridia bacterium]
MDGAGDTVGPLSLKAPLDIHPGHAGIGDKQTACAYSSFAAKPAPGHQESRAICDKTSSLVFLQIALLFAVRPGSDSLRCRFSLRLPLLR